jgi:hypothetical protein
MHEVEVAVAGPITEALDVTTDPPMRTLRDHDGVVHEVRDLDPVRARVRRPRRVAPTRYVADRLIVRTAPGEVGDDALVGAVQEAAERRGLGVRVAAAPVAGSRESTPRQGVVLHVDGDDVDAWDLLDEVSKGVEAPDEVVRIGLDHVLQGHKNWTPHGVPGSREPATFVGPAPRRAYGDRDVWTTADGLARPVVAIVDTGVGQHPWFDAPSAVVARGVLLDGAPIGTYDDREPDGDAEPVVTPEGVALGDYSGHGTFIAGMVHQTCPDAVILPVRVCDDSGEASEWDVARTLERLLEFHRRGVSGVDGHAAIDVAVLPFGFAHEDREGEGPSSVVRDILDDLRAAGVVVIASAGNDGATREVFPAAWAPKVHTVNQRVVPDDADAVSADRTPLLTVGAANPNGGRAEFSNSGPWVTTIRPGVRVVSTMPVTFEGHGKGDSAEAAMLDSEDFTSGFATWSGTSFAAPVLAGEIAQVLLDARQATGAPASEAARVRAAWDAIVVVDGLYLDAPTQG